MTEQDNKEVLLFIREELDRLYEAKEQRLYTCHIVERKYGTHSKEFIWYKNLIKSLPNTDIEFCKELLPIINKHYSSKGDPEGMTLDFFKSGAFIDDNDYESRVLMLDYLTKKFE